METVKDASYGVIPVRKNGEDWEVFLIHQYSRIGNNSYWVFPKGHAEGEEGPQEAALRELKEETNMEVRGLVDEPTFVMEYDFVYDGKKIDKSVTFYVGEVSNDEYKLDPEEVKEAGWYPLDGALKRLDYQDSKTMFEGVVDFLNSFTGIANS